MMPFYFWNGDMREAAIREQLEAFREQGLRGIVLHSRIGNKLEYLSNEWFERIAFTVNVCRELGLKVWLYDEHNWPSGSAGGVVSGLRQDYRTQHLWRVETTVCSEVPDHCIASFVKRNDGTFTRLDPVHAAAYELLPEEKMVYFHIRYGTQTDMGLESLSYVDLLNPRVTDAFIHCTHERYLRHIGFAFGETVEAIYTDEPNLRCDDFFLPHPKLAWTTDLERKFKEAYGYDLIDCLPSLFYNTEAAPQVRYHYHRWIAERFTEAYTRKIGNWCSRHGIHSTGHMLLEETLHYSTMTSGNPMWHFRHMDIPGIDQLGNRIGDRDHPDLAIAIRMARSVALQFEKPGVMAECFGAAGWQFTYRDQRAIADWLMALGVDRLVPHAFSYTLAGIAKRDHPPSFSVHQPSWEVYHQFDHYVRGAAELLAEEEPAGLLVLYPIESVWTSYSPIDAPSFTFPDLSDWPGDPVSYWFRRICGMLLEQHIPFELGDEGLMEEAGELTAEGLRIGARVYKAVLVPPVQRLRPQTVSLLSGFARKYPLWTCLGAAESQEAKTLSGSRDSGLKDMYARSIRLKLVEESGLSALADALKRSSYVNWPWKLTTVEGNCFSTTRRQDGEERLLLVNPYDEPAVVSFEDAGGEHAELRLNAKQSTWLRRSEAGLADMQGNSILPDHGEEPALRMPLTSWQGQALEDNVAVIDRPAMTFRVSGSGVYLRMFVAEQDGELLLNRKRIYLHQGSSRPDSDSWYTGLPHFKRYSIGLMLAPGDYRLEWRVSSQARMEPAYLTGPFRVRLDGDSWVLDDDGSSLTAGSLVRQGYPFYSGKFAFSTCFEWLDGRTTDELFVKWNETMTVIRLIVNGVELAGSIWSDRPLRLPEGCLRQGTNELTLVCATSLRNAMGPHHYEPIYSQVIGPAHYEKGEHWSDSYCVEETSFLGEAVLYRTSVEVERNEQWEAQA